MKKEIMAQVDALDAISSKLCTLAESDGKTLPSVSRLIEQYAPPVRCVLSEIDLHTIGRVSFDIRKYIASDVAYQLSRDIAEKLEYDFVDAIARGCYPSYGRVRYTARIVTFTPQQLHEFVHKIIDEVRA